MYQYIRTEALGLWDGGLLGLSDRLTVAAKGAVIENHRKNHRENGKIIGKP